MASTPSLECCVVRRRVEMLGCSVPGASRCGVGIGRLVAPGSLQVAAGLPIGSRLLGRQGGAGELSALAGSHQSCPIRRAFVIPSGAHAQPEPEPEP